MCELKSAEVTNVHVHAHPRCAQAAPAMICSLRAPLYHYTAVNGHTDRATTQTHLRLTSPLMGVSVCASTKTQRAGTELPALVHCVVALASCRRGPATHTAHAVSMRIEQRTGAWRHPRLPGRPGSSALACGGPPATISCGLLEGRSRGLMPASPVRQEGRRSAQRCFVSRSGACT